MRVSQITVGLLLAASGTTLAHGKGKDPNTKVIINRHAASPVPRSDGGDPINGRDVPAKVEMAPRGDNSPLAHGPDNPLAKDGAAAKRAADGATEAGGCQQPSSFVISDYYENGGAADAGGDDSAKMTVSFRFVDEDKGIDTLCAADGVAVAVSVDASVVVGRDAREAMIQVPDVPDRFPCEDDTVEFTLDAKTGLTLIEKACPGQSDTELEAAGSISIDILDLVCVKQGQQGDGVTCSTTELEVIGSFDIVQAAPPAM